MTGTFINVGAVIAGGAIGFIIKNRLNHRFVTISFQVIGIFTILLGIMMGLKTQNPLIQIISLLTGAWLGEWLNLENLTKKLESKFTKENSNSENLFFNGLLTAFLLFCIGSMTILGAFEEGITGKSDLLIIKSIMDGISSIALVSVFGIGVVFSVIPLLLYQAGLTIFSSYLSNYLQEYMINELTACGGVLLIGIGISILDIKKIRVINMLPSLIIVIFVAYIIHKSGL